MHFDSDAILAYATSKEMIGWCATSCFTLSYFVKKERNLLALQSLASSTWLVYGLVIGAIPLLVANFIVASSAGYKAVQVTLRDKARDKAGQR